MTYQHGKRGIGKLISDPYREWNQATADRYIDFAAWIDAELLDLEVRYAGWETLGYGHWRSQFGATASPRHPEAEAEPTE